MNTLICTDIFGKSSTLEELADAICPNHLIVDPYEGENIPFQSERDAYQFFSSNVGLDNYTMILRDALKNTSTAVNLVGFSIGASAIWNLSESSVCSIVIKGTCFYGSQIRNNRKTLPRFPITLIFPEKEHHFSVYELIADLRDTPKINIRQVDYLHGFMNRLSVNFNLQGYKSELKALDENAN